ncbi:ABC transporter substrate-binding protein [Streptomyces spiramenti]|uniref:ABC transporter substrate-binding protein n=1 Tax=Streptomyces spiramenti TaxID=2720606 RepID=A0ABX1AS59_9ACTN|nr:ABC transporter substrate-binding protein [Streptomyces spiramenti]NJP68576.1 ABC transporter substrate-binding protein [Streptomyces spiramenti]
MPAVTPRPTRRSLLLTGGALGAGAFLTACGSGPATGTSGETDAADGNVGAADGAGWSFTDDRGTTVELPAAPERVVAFIGTAAALHDYGVECSGVFGPTADGDGNPDVQAGDLDITRPVRLGNAWGEFDLDAYATMEPQLLVTTMFSEDALWYVPDDSREQIERLAPTIGLTASPTTLRAAIDRHAELARALGGDLDSPEVAEGRERFDAASEALRAAVRDNPGLRVLAASAADDLLYASTPDAYADLAYFAELGLEVVAPDGVEGGFFENLSWENADRYPADLVLLDNRSSALQPDDLTDRPTWQRLPAVAAGQIVPWPSETRFSHAGCAPFLEELAAAVRDARRVV